MVKHVLYKPLDIYGIKEKQMDRFKKSSWVLEFKNRIKYLSKKIKNKKIVKFK